MQTSIIVYLLLFVPLLGGIIHFFYQRHTWIFPLITFLLSVYILCFSTSWKHEFEWILGMKMGFVIDRTSSLLIFLVTFISFLVHIFSIEYMRFEKDINRYFAKLSFFIFSLIGLLLSNHLVLLFVFWEIMGLSSYLLIGFWYKKNDVPSSSTLVFLVNKISDTFLLLGIVLLYTENIHLLAFSEHSSWSNIPSLLIVAGAFGKSSQLPFSGWLLKAMKGPIPVSALIHAATMVTVGVYLLFRVAPSLSDMSLTMITWVGGITAFYGSLCALKQQNIKYVLAYSTISQLGFMIAGIGLGAGTASLFHLWTHAFFKAGLFLGAGIVVDYMRQRGVHDAENMTHMGGLRSHLPFTCLAMNIFALALAGIPFFSGFMSKEKILLVSWTNVQLAYWWSLVIPILMMITSVITPIYIFRMIGKVFYRKNTTLSKIHFKENYLMLSPIIILIIPTLWIFYDFNPLQYHTWFSDYLFFNSNVAINYFTQTTVIIISISTTLIASGWAIRRYMFSNHQVYIQNNTISTSGFLYKGMFLIDIYCILGKSIWKFSKKLSFIDKTIIDNVLHVTGYLMVVLSKILHLVDKFLVDGLIKTIVIIANGIGSKLASLHARQLRTQLLGLLLGLLIILIWMIT